MYSTMSDMSYISMHVYNNQYYHTDCAEKCMNLSSNPFMNFYIPS